MITLTPDAVEFLRKLVYEETQRAYQDLLQAAPEQIEDDIVRKGDEQTEALELEAATAEAKRVCHNVFGTEKFKEVEEEDLSELLRFVKTAVEGLA
jgi:hypothetical protein